jgi:hypothetical protein
VTRVGPRLPCFEFANFVSHFVAQSNHGNHECVFSLFQRRKRLKNANLKRLFGFFVFIRFSMFFC